FTCERTCLTPDQVVTEQQSLIVMKKLLAIAVSGITYLRGIFPGKAYGKKYVDGQEVVILREEHSCPGVIHILHCAEMLKKPTSSFSLQLSSLLLFQKVLEVYQFKIQYNTGGALMDFESNNNSKLSMSCGNTKAASILLVRKLYTLMQNLGPLPDTVCLSMKLAYYDDITPLDYQPPGFKEAESGTMEFESEPLRLTMGEVVTPFHSLKLDMTTERRRIDQVNVNSSDAVTDKWTLEVTENDEEEELTQVMTQAAHTKLFTVLSSVITPSDSRSAQGTSQFHARNLSNFMTQSLRQFPFYLQSKHFRIERGHTEIYCIWNLTQLYV
uniref:HORMA domain containing 1 n=1 Tax=Salarias fasciatus TaxID=181472 RepID=A0A672GSZ8_SALFA